MRLIPALAKNLPLFSDGWGEHQVSHLWKGRLPLRSFVSDLLTGPTDFRHSIGEGGGGGRRRGGGGGGGDPYPLMVVM